jgi:hypothetical protein
MKSSDGVPEGARGEEQVKTLLLHNPAHPLLNNLLHPT